MTFVTVSTSSSQPRRSAARWRAGTASIAVVGLVALAACGSSKPAYCTARTNLENSIKGLTSFNPSSGVSGLQSQVTKIQTDANMVVSQAKSDFPSQTSALKSSVNALANSVKALPANPSASQIATVAKDATNVSSSVSSFVNATSSKCS